MVKSKTYLRKNAKRILYILYKKTNRTLSEFGIGRGLGEESRNYFVLRHLRKKGLVDMTEYLSGNIYWLTPEGKKAAEPIVDEIDEYKTW